MAHLLGSVTGGAIVGIAIGAAGLLLMLPDVRPWVIGAAGLIALTLRYSRKKIGRGRQVPRNWARSGMSRERLFFLWGALLGCGIATETAYPAILVLAGVQATVGPFFGGLLGALFGLSRGAVGITLSLTSCDPVSISNMLPKFTVAAARLNFAITIGGTAALIAAAT